MQTYNKIKLGKIHTSNVELKDLGKSWLAISIAFAIALNGISLNIDFLIAILISALTVGVGFLGHELAHKFIAQKYGIYGEFRANPFMLLIAIAISFLGVVFAAPGGVKITTAGVGKTREGKISAAGPAANLIIAGLFLAFPRTYAINRVCTVRAQYSQ